MLIDKYISDKDYQHALNFGMNLKWKIWGEYHDLYLKTDVLLIADVFEIFRHICVKYFGLDLCHYFSRPGLICCAMFKMKDVELDLSSDIDIYKFFEKV